MKQKGTAGETNNVPKAWNMFDPEICLIWAEWVINGGVDVNNVVDDDVDDVCLCVGVCVWVCVYMCACAYVCVWAYGDQRKMLPIQCPFNLSYASITPHLQFLTILHPAHPTQSKHTL